METPPRSLMASYLERWEQQKAQSRRERAHEARRRSSDVGDELSFISAIEREASQQPRNLAAEPAERPWEEDGHGDFDLPAMDAFPDSPFTQEAHQALHETEMPPDEEFVDAATFLKKNELGGDDSFSQDVTAAALVSGDWDQNTSGRPSDFFQQKSRNLDHVELSSSGGADISFGDVEPERTDHEKNSEMMPEDRGSNSDLRQGMAILDQFDRSSGLSGTATALSSGNDVHFDNARLVYTPKSMKYLQERKQAKVINGTSPSDWDLDCVPDHTGEAVKVAKIAPPAAEQDVPNDASPEFVAALQRGPGVVKEALHEIDVLIDRSNELATLPPREQSLGVDLTEGMREFVRSYELPLESMIPLSRTTDSWGEDVSVSQIDDDMNHRGRDLERLSNSTESRRPTLNGITRSRSQDTPELDTISEIPLASNTGSVSQKFQQTESSIEVQQSPLSRRNNADCCDDDIGERGLNDELQHSRKDSKYRNRVAKAKRSSDSGFRVSSPSSELNSLAQVASSQNSFHDQVYSMNKADAFSEQPVDEDENASVTSEDYRKSDFDRSPVNNKDRRYNAAETNKTSGIDLRFRFGAKSPTCRTTLRRKQIKDWPHTGHSIEPKTSAVQKHPLASDDVLDMTNHNVACETAMMPRRCRRFLCSVGDVMTEQVVFTNGSHSVSRICVSLLPLSTGCQQFSVSPAVLELGPQASSAFHVTFNARYVGAVSGIFQFRGVGADSLFRPYEVVIEASVKRNLELGAPRVPKQGIQHEELSKRVQELQTSTSIDNVQVSPTFIRFERIPSKSGEKTIKKAKLRLSNNTSQALPFNVRYLENLRVHPTNGLIQPASEIAVYVLPISRPFAQEMTEGEGAPVFNDWYGSLTVRIGKSFSREVSVVVDRRVTKILPLFTEIARSRHQISSQTDSFYYTKRGKRSGLYFHARAVEFGCCNVGEAHEVPVYVCNGSKSPMTVFLQDLQEPFSCTYATTTIEPRKFIEVMVTFTPKVVGKVATSLFAYSVSDKAVVTLVARGI